MTLLRELLAGVRDIFTAMEHKPLPVVGSLCIWLERRRNSGR